MLHKNSIIKLKYLIGLLTLCTMFFNCSNEETINNEEELSRIEGVYCLDFAIVGSQLKIIKNDDSQGYQIEFNDFDGGLYSGMGTGTLNGTSLIINGFYTIDAGETNFTATLDFDSSFESVSGGMDILNPQGTIILNASINGIKGECDLELETSDISQIIDQPYLTSLHVELDKIKKISRYRSSAGHNFVDYSGESCVNLKHYFHTYAEGELDENVELPTSLNYYAPANGTIVSMSQVRINEDPTDYEIDIRLADNENVIVRLFHVNPISSLNVGTEVLSGQQIGSAPLIHLRSGDFAVYILTKQGYRHISMFEIMSTDTLNSYIEKGIDLNWKQDLYYETTNTYVSGIFCENDTWGNLNHPSSNFELDFHIFN